VEGAGWLKALIVERLHVARPAKVPIDRRR